MKFKKEDIGLYFALGLAGAGMGLLIGALIASRREGPEPIVQRDDFDLDYKKKEDYPESKVRIDNKEYVMEVAKDKKAKEALEFEKELAHFLTGHEPTAIQIEMLKSGLMTFTELEKVLEEEQHIKDKERYSYSKQYTEFSSEEFEPKPDLSALVKLPEEEDVIDSRYELSQKPPSRKSTKNMRAIYYDAEDDALYTMTRQKQPVPVASVEEFVSSETWAMLQPYLIGGFSMIYVNDRDTAKFYRFQLVEDEEESS